MRKLLAIALLVPLLTVAAVNDDEPFSPGEEQWAHIDGSIELPTRFTDGEGGWPGLGRRVYNCSAGTNGLIAYIFDVFPDTWGGPFVLDSVTDETGAADVDIYFYSEFADCGGQASPTTVGQFDSPDPGEFGFIPEGARKAVAFTPTGVQTSFLYRAWAPPQIDLATEPLDLTVARGATVVWHNDGDDYAYVRHVPADGGAVAFDSSPGPGTGIPVGADFTHTFSQVGTYAYDTPHGGGTITVVDPA